MPEGINPTLLLAAALNAIIGVLHLAVIAVGPRWYRLFGAGERMAVAAEKGRWYPALVTAAIACVLLAWSAYALSAAGQSAAAVAAASHLPHHPGVPAARSAGAKIAGGHRAFAAFYRSQFTDLPGLRPGAPGRAGAAVASAGLIPALKQHLTVID